MSTPSRYLLLIISLFLYCEVLYAQTVSLKTSEGKIANAEYRLGEPDSPLLIFIHGFLQTSDFSTVERLSNGLYESDYSVLSPTLSLGVSNRSQALPCEAIHLHSLSNDIEEIAQWVSWASKQGHKEIILIGHSAGSVAITAYLAQKVHPAVKKTVLISLTHYGPGRPAAFETEAHAQKARHMLQQGDSGLEKFALEFCKDYVSTAENFLSYYDWAAQHVLNAISEKNSKNYILMGSADERIEKNWLSLLQKASEKTIVIEGASHFFDQSYEFELLDTVENILNN